MCGINCIIDKTNFLDDFPIQKMNQTLKHRGDSIPKYKKKTYQNRRFFLGHILLQIKDFTEKALQPFFSEDENYALIFNGEIYNELALKKKLRKKFHFKTETDTEILLYALMTFEEKVVSDLEGMFAFIFFDFQNGKMIVARDENHIKPLFFFESEKYLIFSSEIKGILASDLLKKEINYAQIPHYLTYKFTQKPATFFKNIFEVTNSFTLDLNSFQKKNIPIQTQENSLKPTLQIIEHSLMKSIKSRWSDKLLIGLFLSGGVDSTLLLALARKLLNEKQIIPDKIYTFSIGFDEKTKLKDADFARLASQKFGSEHYQVMIEKPTFNDLMKVIITLDQPIADSAFYLTYHLSKYARNFVKIVLSGAGADEIFAGYRRHLAFFQYLRYKSLLLKIPLERIFKNFPINQDLKKVFSRIDKSEQETFLNFTASNFLPLFKNKLRKEKFKDLFSLEDALVWDRKNYMASDILAINDQMAMQHSLEVRVPYLDRNLISLVEKIPAKERIRPESKWILKQILAKQGGADFAYRKKQGFGVPLKKWFKENPEFFDFLQDKKYLLQDFLTIELQEKLFKNYQKQNLSQEIWALLTLQIYLDHHLN